MKPENVAGAGPAEETWVEIAIPTYNRLSCLEQCLNALSESFAAVPEHLRRPVKASIWDGGSSDTTPEWVRANAHRFSFPIELVDVPGPLSFGERAVGFVARSSAKFIWYFSDDDMALPESFTEVLSVTGSHPEIGAVYLNHSQWNADLSVCLNPKAVPVTNAEISSDVNNVGLLGQHGGFLPALIVSRACAQAVPIADKVVRGAWPHVVPFIVAAATRGLIIIEQPLIRGRCGNSEAGKASATSSWYPVFVQDWSIVCDECARLGLPRRLVRLLRAGPLRERNLSFRRIVGERLNHLYQPPNLFAICVSEYGTYPQFWRAVAPAFLVPIGLLCKIRSIYRTFRRAPARS